MRSAMADFSATRIMTLLLAILASSIVQAQQAAYDFPTDPYARDLVQLTSWFEGEFDNEEQLWFQNDPRSKTAEEDKHPRLHTIHRRLDLPSFGKHVFYVEEYVDNDPTNVIRQRLVIFTSEGLGRGIRMRQGFFRNADAALGAQFAPDRLAQVQSDDVFFMDECDVFWRREASQFKGEIPPKSCILGDGELRRYSVHQLILSADKYWRVDATRLLATDELHVGFAETNPTKMQRARIFRCDLTVRDEAGESYGVTDMRVHDQGGFGSLTLGDGGDIYRVRLRNKEYPFYDTRPDFLFLAVLKEGQARSVAYAVSDPDARRISVTGAGVTAHCHREGYQFREPVELLQ